MDLGLYFENLSFSTEKGGFNRNKTSMSLLNMGNGYSFMEDNPALYVFTYTLIGGIDIVAREPIKNVLPPFPEGVYSKRKDLAP